MARPIRVEFEGAVYHLMARGNERRAIFRDDQDRKRFLDTLAEMVEQFGVRLHAYCLMPNHYHLVVGTPRGNLSQAAGWLQLSYSVRFNRRHRRSGHLFQGRFKAQLVEADEYARWLVEYVHLNPVRPRKKGEPIPPERAEELKRYEWSSHRDYAGWRKQSPGWLCLDWLAYWGRSRREAQAEYRQAIRRAFGRAVSNPWQQLRGGLVLGGEELLATARGLIGRKPGVEEAQWTVARSAQELQQQVRALVKAEGDERIRMWARVRLGGERRIAVAQEHGYRDGSGVTYLINRLEQQARTDAKLSGKLGRLRSKMS